MKAGLLGKQVGNKNSISVLLHSSIASLSVYFISMVGKVKLILYNMIVYCTTRIIIYNVYLIQGSLIQES